MLLWSAWDEKTLFFWDPKFINLDKELYEFFTEKGEMIDLFKS